MRVCAASGEIRMERRVKGTVEKVDRSAIIPSQHAEEGNLCLR